MFHNLENYNILFYGKDIIVVAKLFDSKECIITFTAWGKEVQLPMPPFAAGLLDTQNISHICIISMSNHWWSTGEWIPCLNAVKNFISLNNLKKTVLYGGSMGGYGALLASNCLVPDRVVVFGAQFSISPKVIPADSRWLSDWNNLFSNKDMKLPEVPFSSEVIYLYDPNTIDKLHAHQYKEAIKQICFIRFPFAGHEVFNTLKELKLAGEIALYTLSFDHSIDSIREFCCVSYRENRRDSQSYWKNILSYKKENRLKASAISFLLKEPDLNFVSKLALANELNSSGQSADNIKGIYFSAIIELPTHPAPWRGLWAIYAKEEKYLLSLKSALIALANRENDEDLLRVVVLAADAAGDRKLVELVASILLEKDIDGVHTLNVLNKAKFDVSDRISVSSEAYQDFRRFLAYFKEQALNLSLLNDTSIDKIKIPQLENINHSINTFIER